MQRRDSGWFGWLQKTVSPTLELYKRKVFFPSLEVYRWHFEVCPYFVIQYHTVVTCLDGMRRDLHCNPMKVVVSGKVLFVPGWRKWDSLRDWVSRGWRGISHSLPFRADVILSSPCLGCLSWQPKKACAHPTVPSAWLEESLLCTAVHSRTNGPEFNHVMCQWLATIGRRWLHYHIDESSSCLFRLADGRKVCLADNKRDYSWAYDPYRSRCTLEINSHSFRNTSHYTELSPVTMMSGLRWYRYMQGWHLLPSSLFKTCPPSKHKIIVKHKNNNLTMIPLIIAHGLWCI